MSPAILHVSQPVDYGVAACVADLAADQVRRGWRVAVACPTDGPLAAEVAAGGAQHVHWPARRSPAAGLVTETRLLARAIDDLRPDVVHLHSAKAGLVGRLVLRGRTPTIFQPHAWSFDAARGAQRAAAIRWERLAARWAGAVVCCSDDELRVGAEAGIRGRWVVVPNSVDLDHFASGTDGCRADARRRVGLDPAAPVAVCVGRLSHQKGQDVALAAWPEVRRRVPGATLVLVGDGPERTAFEAAAVPGVVLAGPQDDVRPWLVAADLAVLPSRYEGMALSVLEAMATGRAVVAAAADGMAAAIGRGEDAAGAIVPVGDPAALAAAVAERLASPERAAQEGRRGRARAEANHDRRAWRDRFADLATDVATDLAAAR